MLWNTIFQIDWTTPVSAPTPRQYALALLILGVLTAAGLVLVWRAKVAGLPENEKRQRDETVGQRVRQTPATMRLATMEVLQDARGELRDLFVEETEPERETVRGAVGSVYAAAVEPMARLPRTARRLAELAVLAAVGGAVAVSTQSLLALLDTGDGGVTLGNIVQDIQYYTDILIQGFETLIAHYPAAELVYSLGLTAVIQIGELLYTHWWFTALVLAAGAVVTYLLHRKTGGADVDLVDRWRLARFTAVGVVVAYVAGVIPAAIGDAAGASGIGGVVGVLFSTLVVLAMLIGVIREYIRRLVLDSRKFGERTPLVALNVLAHRVWTGFAIVSIPVILSYYATAISQGDLVRVWQTLLTAGTGVKLLVGLAVGGVLAWIGYAAYQEFDAIRSGLSETLSRRSVRASIFARGLPIGVVALTFIVVSPVISSIVGSVIVTTALSLVVSMAAAGLTRKLYHVAERARYAASLFDDDVSAVRNVVVLAYELDVDGKTLYYARVNGDVELLTEDVDEMVDLIVDVGEEMFRDGETEPRVAEFRAQYAMELGLIDEERVISKIVEECEKDLLRLLRDERLVTREKLEREVLDEYPDVVVDEELSRLWRQGVISHPADDHVRLRTDPRSSD